MKRGIFMKGIIKRGSLKCVAFAAACLITVSDANYINFTEVHSAASVSDEYKSWKQGDSRWKDLHLGRSKYTMEHYGCAVTSLASLLVHAGNFRNSEFDPGMFCRLMSQFGGFSYDGDIIWGKVSSVSPTFTFDGTLYFNDNTTDAEKIKKIKELYNNNFYLIIDVNNSGHWVAIDRIENGVIYSIDPAGNRNPEVFKQYNIKETTCIKKFRSTGITSNPPEVKNFFSTGRYVTTTRVNVRKSATSSSEKLGELEKGTQFTVSQVEGYWGKFSFKGVSAWICLDYAEKINESVSAPSVSQTPAVTEKPAVTTTVTEKPAPVVNTVTAKPVQPAPEITTAAGYKTGRYVTNDYLNYRDMPDVNNSVIYGVIKPGTEINVTEISGKWGRTEFNGKKCWVCLDYADFVSGISSPVTTAVTTTATTPAATTVTTTVTSLVTTVTTTVTTPVTTTVTTVTSPETTVTSPVTTVSETVKTPEVSEENNVTFKCRTTDALNFRTGAGTQNQIICVIPAGTELTVFEADGEGRWGRVDYKNQSGWVCLDYVVLSEEMPVPSEPEITEPADPETDITETPGTPPSSEIIIGAADESAVKNENASGIFRGDVDGNGFINILDYVKLMSFFEGEHYVSEEADVNGDGVINLSDLFALRKIFLK